MTYNVKNNQIIRKMKLIVTKIQPSKFWDRNTIINKAQKKQFNKQKIVIGRGECLQQQKTQKSDTYSVDHKSISRKHALISIPYQYSNCNRQLLVKSMAIKANSMIPKFYSKLGGIWGKIPQDLQYKIREYSGPQNVLVMRDLNSRYGLYQKVQRITILNGLNKRNSSIFKSEASQLYNFYNVTINNKQSFTMQMGNQLIQVLEIKFNVTKNQLKQYKTYLQTKFKQVNYYSTDRLDINTNGFNQQINYCCILLKQADEKTSPLCIILQSRNKQRSKEVSIGRNSMCSIQINKSSISRKQTSLYLDEKSNIIIQDNNSTNGTWLKCDKIKYKIDRVHQLFFESMFNYSDSDIHNTYNYINKNNTCIHVLKQKSKRECLIVKLGEIRFDIQIQKSVYMWNDIIKNIRSCSTGQTGAQYTRILDELLQINQISQIQDQNCNEVLSLQNIQGKYGNIQKFDFEQNQSQKFV